MYIYRMSYCVDAAGHVRNAQYALALLLFSLILTTVTVGSAATKKPPLKPININTANSEELQQVPGIGPATAEKILQMRKSYGPFKNVDDLLAIKGLGRKRLDKMRKYLTVSKSPASNKPGPSAKPAPAPPESSQQSEQPPL